MTDTTTLLRQASALLTRWDEFYGRWCNGPRHENALPPAGTVTLQEDIAEALATPTVPEAPNVEKLLDEWAEAAGHIWYHCGASRGIETGRGVSRHDLRQLVNAALSAAPAVREPQPTYSSWVWKHTKSGGEYQLIGNATIQTDRHLPDMADVYVYQGDDGSMWVRPVQEFNERFKRIRPLSIERAHGITGDSAPAVREPQPVSARPASEYHEDHGAVLWWTFPINEPPYCGQPSDDDWPAYHTHWTPLVLPGEPGSAHG